MTPNIAGQFDTFDAWVSGATRALANKTCPSSGATVAVPAICVDTKGRRCFQGSDFMRARDEGTFPVVYFWDCAEQAKPLEWTRVQDGYYGGKPVYEYTATSGDRKYHIVWAYDRGGTFGYSATRPDAKGDSTYLTDRWGIHWSRTLKFCKEACENIERKHSA